VDKPTVAYKTKLHTPVTDVLSGKEEAGNVNLATFAFAVPAGMVIVLAVKFGLKLVNKVPVTGNPENTFGSCPIVILRTV
jgi:hypothetical protein